MTQVKRTIKYAAQNFPTGTIAGKTRVIFSLADGSNSQIKEIDLPDQADSADVDFEASITGDYIISVSRLDANGQQLSAPIVRQLGTITVDPGVSIMVPVDVLAFLI